MRCWMVEWFWFWLGWESVCMLIHAAVSLNLAALAGLVVGMVTS